MFTSHRKQKFIISMTTVSFRHLQGVFVDGGWHLCTQLLAADVLLGRDHQCRAASEHFVQLGPGGQHRLLSHLSRVTHTEIRCFFSLLFRDRDTLQMWRRTDRPAAVELQAGGEWRGTAEQSAWHWSCAPEHRPGSLHWTGHGDRLKKMLNQIQLTNLLSPHRLISNIRPRISHHSYLFYFF